MKFSSQIKDAAKYTFRDWKAIVLLGIILCIASTLDETYTDNLLLLIIMVLAAIALLFIEEGYRYKIIKETIEGNNSPPLIGNFSELIKEGFLETITLLIYIGIALALITIIENFIKAHVPETYQIIILIFFY